MLVSLFVVMTYLTGETITYRYATPMDQFQCDKQAHIEAEKLDEGDTSAMKNIEIVCMSETNFVRKYL